MRLDDKICYCYHVSLRKLVNYARREAPPRASGMSECLGAGTGCGWCIPMLKRIHRQVAEGHEFETGRSVDGLPETADDYSNARSTYLKSDDKNAF